MYIKSMDKYYRIVQGKKTRNLIIVTRLRKVRSIRCFIDYYKPKKQE